MPPDPAKRTLLELAEHRLRTLFPAHFQSIISPPQSATATANVPEEKRAAPPPQPAVAESKPAAKPEAAASTSARCCVRGCVFPVKLDGLCRTHFLDSRSEKSLLPSATAVAIDNLGMLVALLP